jgi:hypothetical protein
VVLYLSALKLLRNCSQNSAAEQKNGNSVSSLLTWVPLNSYESWLCWSEQERYRECFYLHARAYYRVLILLRCLKFMGLCLLDVKYCCVHEKKTKIIRVEVG